MSSINSFLFLLQTFFILNKENFPILQRLSRPISPPPIISISKHLLIRIPHISSFLEQICILLSQCIGTVLDNNPSILIAWRKWRGPTLQPVVKPYSGSGSPWTAARFGFEEEVVQVELVVSTFVLAVAVEHVPREFLEERVVGVDFLVLQD